MSIINGQDANASDLIGTRYRIIAPMEFIASVPARLSLNINYIRCLTLACNFHAKIDLPDGCTLTRVKFYVYREDTLCEFKWAIYKIAKDNSGTIPIEILTLTNITHTDGEKELDSGALSEVIDNNAYYYQIFSSITINDGAGDAEIHSAVLTYEITHPKP